MSWKATNRLDISVNIFSTVITDIKGNLTKSTPYGPNYLTLAGKSSPKRG